MQFKRKEIKFDPSLDLRLVKKKYLYEGKVVKEEEYLEARENNFSSTRSENDWWGKINQIDRIYEITDHKELQRMGIESPS